MKPVKFLLIISITATAVMAASVASAAYPERPIRLLVGYPPGGGTDLLGRIAARELTERLDRQVVVDNRAGANGLIATDIAARANPDGYTLLFTSIPYVINPHLRKVNYDALKDFAPVIQFVAVPLTMASYPGLPVTSVKELIAYAKKNPGALNYGSAGSGSSSHLAMELFKSMAGIDMVHIPYKGTGPLIQDMLSGRIQVTITSAVALAPHVRSGRLKGLGVTSPKRSAAFPELPAIAETVPGYEVVNWYGIFAPAGTPKAVTARLNAVLNDALKTPELVKLLRSSGADPVGGSPEQFAEVIRADYAKWGKVVEASGARVE